MVKLKMIRDLPFLRWLCAIFFTWRGHLKSLASDMRQSPNHVHPFVKSSNTEDQNPDTAANPMLLWQHPSPTETQMWKFMQQVNRKHGKQFNHYAQLHNWGIDNLSSLWAEIWDYCNIRYSVPYEQVVSDPQTMWPRPRWFTKARLNFAENLLFPPKLEMGEDDLAVIAASETDREQVTWKELRERVRICQAGMRSLDVHAGDRIAGFVANHTNALVTMLAATSLGAIWTAVSPDTGVTATVDRFLQTNPLLLFADNALLYKGQMHSALSKVREITAALPSLKATIIFNTSNFEANTSDLANNYATVVISYDEFTKGTLRVGELAFPQFPAEHPVYILYSSGTTGVPKCIVHGAIGTLLQHKKEHMIHSDIRPGDRFCQITTCMWMMWHWLVSGLASGATIVLYNGSPFHYSQIPSHRVIAGDQGARLLIEDHLAMPKLIDELKITQFGTSARYLSMLEQRGILPMASGLALDTLQAVYSTGSPLAASTFRYVYKAFGPIHLGSISGGTDIISDFGTPCTLNPVHAGELQVLGLGLSVQAWDEHGKDISASGKPGELVCTRPFPSQPVSVTVYYGSVCAIHCPQVAGDASTYYMADDKRWKQIQFWGPDGDKKYKRSYFDRFNGTKVWAHGDFVRFNPLTGGLIILGRSDGVLNPSGVRFGSAEIYNLLQEHFADVIEDSLCVGKRHEHDADETVVLFVKMKGVKTFDSNLEEDIRAIVRKELSPRHIPGVITECPDIPLTPNGKKVEVLIKQITSGSQIQVGYGNSVTNHDCLDWYRKWAKTYVESQRALNR